MVMSKPKQRITMNNEDLGLRSPWVLYHEKVKALFGGDNDISIEFDNEKMKLTIKVNGTKKADALSRLIPGHVGLLKVYVVPANSGGDTLPDDASPLDIANAAFEGNSAIAQIRAVSKGLFRGLCYCVFKKEVIQYPADNLADINGNESTLMEFIAEEVMENSSGIYFCTSAGLKDANGFGDAPLGEWP